MNESISGNPEYREIAASHSGLGILPQYVLRNFGGRFATNWPTVPELAVMIEASTSAIAALATDVKALVDRLEADWQTRHILRLETVEELHALRQRAERLFGDYA